MGLGRLLLLGDLGQHLDIQDLHTELHRLRSDKRDHDHVQDRDIARLQAENDALQLCVGLLIRKLVTRSLLDQTEVAELVQAIEPVFDEPVPDEDLAALEQAVRQSVRGRK